MQLVTRTKWSFLAAGVVVLACYVWQSHVDPLPETPSLLKALISPKNGAHFLRHWSSVASFALAVVILITTALIPSMLDKRVKMLVSELRTNLRDFDQIFNTTVDMVNKLACDSDSELYIVGLFPWIGLEESRKRQVFDNLLVARLSTDRKTYLVLLGDSSNPTSTASLAPFLKELARYAVTRMGVPGPANTLYTEMAAFVQWQLNRLGSSGLLGKRKRVWLSDTIPYQLIIARPSSGPTSAVMFFSDTDSLQKNLRPVGFYTSEPQFVQVIERAFSMLSSGQPWLDTF